MRIMIFGTGIIFFRFWPYLDKKQVVCLIDNNTNKIGKYIDGVKIVSPDELMYYDYDAVLILSLHYLEMKKQLAELGVSESIVYHYGEIGNLFRREITICNGGQRSALDIWIHGNCNNKKILLLSHELSRTGASIALMNMARILRKMGHSVIYAGVVGGTLIQELEADGLEYICDWGFVSQEEQKECIEKFDMAVICSYGLKMYVQEYSGLCIPILWWIHEAEEFYRGKMETSGVGENVHVYCGGKYAREIFQAHYKASDTKILQYCIPEDESAAAGRKGASDRICIALIGTVCKRKAQDVLLRAVSSLSLEYQERLEVLMVGSVLKAEQNYWDTQESLVKGLENVRMIGEVSQKELAQIYQGLDVLVCPSRDDPMPIVVTQAMMYGKVCIISENVGQVEFIRQGENGFIFHSQDELTALLKWVVDNKDKMADIGKRARQIYEQNFSDWVMEEKLRLFIEDNVQH